MSKKYHQCGLLGERRKIRQTLRKVGGRHGLFNDTKYPVTRSHIQQPLATFHMYFSTRLARFVGHSRVYDDKTQVIGERRSTSHFQSTTSFLILTTPL